MFETLRHLFTPHHSNNHRPRILHPMGFVVMIAIVLVTHSGVALIEEYQPAGLVLGYASNISVDQVYQQTNQERVNNGLSPLAMSPKLNQAAAAKAADMFANNYWAHISPSGIPPWTFIKNTGYRYSVAGENLARDFDTTGPMVSAWMASPTHKANIVHLKYTETGIAVVNGNLDGVDTTLVVQMFGHPVQPTITSAPSTPTPAPQITEVAPEPEVDPVVEETSAPRADTFIDVELPIREPATELSFEPAVLSEESVQVPTTSHAFISPIDLKKSAVLAVIFLIMGVLIVDEIIIRNRKTVRFVGRNAAHLSFMVLVLIIVWNVIQPGLIQ